MEAENQCASQMRSLIDQISMQQGRNIALEGWSLIVPCFMHFFLVWLSMKKLEGKKIKLLRNAFFLKLSSSFILGKWGRKY